MATQQVRAGQAPAWPSNPYSYSFCSPHHLSGLHWSSLSFNTSCLELSFSLQEVPPQASENPRTLTALFLGTVLGASHRGNRHSPRGWANREQGGGRVPSSMISTAPSQSPPASPLSQGSLARMQAECCFRGQMLEVQNFLHLKELLKKGRIGTPTFTKVSLDTEAYPQGSKGYPQGSPGSISRDRPSL